MATSIVFPKVSLETDSGFISRWLKQDGDQVEQGDVLFEIDNDKAAVEVEAPASGILGHIRKAGHEVQVGEVVGRILAPGEQPADSQSPVAEGRAGSASAAAGSRPSDLAEPLPAGASTARIVATPLARRIAEQRRIDLTSVRGSGPRGRIQKRDLLETAAPAPVRPVAVAQAPLHAAWLQKEGEATVVALHGFASDHNAWRALSSTRGLKARLLAVDLPGHGRSPRVVPRDLDAVCEMVEARLAAEGVEAATLVGHSFGAAVVARLASPGHVSGRPLLLMSPAGLGPEIRAAFVDGFVLARQAPSLLPWLHELVFDASGISPAFLRAVEEQRRDEGLTRSLQEFAQRYFADGTQTFSVRQDLERLRVPTRVIFGVQDRIIPFSHGNLLPARIGLHAFQQCGHLPYMEQAELSLAILNEMVALGQAGR